MKRIRLFIVLIIVSVAVSAMAEVKIYQKEYAHTADFLDTKETSKVIACHQARQFLLDDAVASFEKIEGVKSLAPTRAALRTLLSGILWTLIEKETWDGTTFGILLKGEADTDQVLLTMAHLTDSNKIKLLEARDAKAETLFKEIESLRAELPSEWNDDAREKAVRKYESLIGKLRASNLFLNGYALLKAGRWTEAGKNLNRVIQADPNDGEAYFLRGVSNERLGRFAGAIDDYTRAIKLNPENGEAYYRRGLVLDRRGRYQKALGDFTHTIRLNPTKADAYFFRGRVYAKLRKYGAAVGDFDKAIALNPSDAESFIERGNVYAKIGKNERAASDFQRAVALNPRNVSAYYNRGTAYQDIRRYDFTGSEKERWNAANPGEIASLHQQNLSKDRTDLAREAIKEYNDTLSLNPKDAMAYFLRGLVYGTINFEMDSLKDIRTSAKLGYKPAQSYLKAHGDEP